MVNKDELLKLHTIVSTKFDIGTLEEFTKKMITKEQRKKFFDLVTSKNFDIGDYDEYERRLSTPISSSGNGNVSQGWLPDPTGNQTWEYQVRDCKWIAKKKGQTQEYLISDNQKYASSVKILNDKYPDLLKNCNNSSSQQNQPNNQNVVTGGGQQPNQTGSTPSTGSQPAPNQTQGLGIPNSIDLGLDEILKLGNPVKTESQPNNTQVPVDGSLEGAPTTQQESIEDNTNVLKEEFYSTLKKIS
jgi:hypothetical protein